jgi:hypothetical protein
VLECFRTGEPQRRPVIDALLPFHQMTALPKMQKAHALACWNVSGGYTALALAGAQPTQR